MNDSRLALQAEHVMIDLETMGTGPDAAICAIGAVAFLPESGLVLSEHYQVVDLASAVACGGRMDASTVLWWMQQADAARAELQRESVNIEVALAEFSLWMARVAAPHVQVWGNGSDFDNVILAGAYRRQRLEQPWRWSRNRCYRTAKAWRPDVLLARTGTAHHALDDARYQAQHLMLMLRTADAAAATGLVALS